MKENPFLILGVAATASPMEIERAGQKLLALLEIGAASAQYYTGHDGPCLRRKEAVRQALADLRNPERRLLAELWSQHTVTENNLSTLEPWKNAPELLCGRPSSFP